MNTENLVRIDLVTESLHRFRHAEVRVGVIKRLFAANVKAKDIDLTNLDFVVLSHRHSDHMAGLSHVLSVNPKVKIYAPKEGFGGRAG